MRQLQDNLESELIETISKYTIKLINPEGHFHIGMDHVFFF